VTSQPGLAGALNNLALLLADVGEREDALAAHEPVAVALPSIQEAVGLTDAGRQWAVTSYANRP
jgi:hypothetical protein